MQYSKGAPPRQGRRKFDALCATLLALTLSLAAGPAAAVRRDAALAVDANTGEVLHAQAADEPRYPASLTKMMTLYIVFSEIEAGRLSYDSRIRISERAASVAPSKLDLAPGSEIRLIDAIKALVTKSANDVAVAIAEHIAGSEAAFARHMNDRARQLGMRGSRFQNASGLPDENQVTTARDMVTLALRIYDDFPKHYRLFSLRSFTYNGDTYRNHNTLLFHYPGTEGMKTGYTRMSGFNLVTSVRRDGRHVVAAVFGGSTAGTRNAHMRSILNRTIPRASAVKTRKPAPLLIAKPKAAPRPAAQIALKAAPKPAQRPAARPAPAAPPAAGPAPAPEAPAMRPAAPEFAMARVKPVDLAALPAAPGPATPNAQAGLTAIATASVASPPPMPQANEFRSAAAPASAAPPADAPPSMTETVISKSTLTLANGVRAPSTLEAQLAALAAEPAPSAAPPSAPAPSAPQKTASPARPAPAKPAAATAIGRTPQLNATAARARPPSTLAAQAAQLPRPAQHLGGPAPAPASAAAAIAGPAEIEIGTFGSAEEAETRMEVAQAKVPALAGRTALALPVGNGSGMAYRARFTGFDGTSASAACQELKRAAIGCRIMAAN